MTVAADGTWRVPQKPRRDGGYVCGLATDYCVKATALDAVGLGFKTYLVEAACRGVELQAGDARRAIKKCARQGVVIVQGNV